MCAGYVSRYQGGSITSRSTDSQHQTTAYTKAQVARMLQQRGIHWEEGLQALAQEEEEVTRWSQPAREGLSQSEQIALILQDARSRGAKL